MKNLISLFAIFSILFSSACDDDDTPTMSTCVLYGDDPVACEAAGCTVMGGERTVYSDERCVAYAPFACFPRKDGDCSSVERSYCSLHDRSSRCGFQRQFLLSKSWHRLDQLP